MSNAAFREMNRRQYIQWAAEIAALVAGLIYWQWQALALFMSELERVQARAVALSHLLSWLLPAPMLDRITLVVDTAGHINTPEAILQAVQAPEFASLRFGSWIYLLLPPSLGILAAVAILYTAHRLRARKGKTEHVRGAEIDDRT